MSTLIFNIVFYFTELIQILIFMAGCYFFGISVFGWIKRKDISAKSVIPKKRFALVVAAHNEELVIGHIIDSLFKLNYPRNLYDVFVVADNCTDNTAEIARKFGAKVHIREDTVKKGKGHALEWMFDKIFNMSTCYDAVAVFDADNLVSTNFLLEMNKQLNKGYKVVQGYIDSKNPYDSWITCSYSIAFWLSNRVFQLPRYYLRLSCGLCGTGFCIDTSILKTLKWGATCLTEDLEYTMKLALNGVKIGWAHEAIVYDEKPITLKQSWNQRKRWMQGHAECAQKYLGSLFKQAFSKGDLISLDCALYLFQPIRIVFVGLMTVMMWIQTVSPKFPLYNIQYVFPVQVWYIMGIFEMLYGPLIILAEKKFSLKVILGLVIYPYYCLTWVPITIQGFLEKDNKEWNHTAHTRQISINELENSNG
ncbi:MAG TPA: glycosyltransferase family 2 protein [Ruminiclostridium sp.]|nr:glycosyltransferase family 2 protein [Ruminiclostridium sp.]